METILDIISDYGLLSYIILFSYCALKSGSLPLFAGIAAHMGALNLALVAAAVFFGGYLGDELRFYLGRKYGVENLSSNPRYQKSLHTAKLLLDRFGKVYIFLYRYPKGMRTIGSLPVALTDMSWRVFTMLNFASALTWTFALVGSGFLFGSALENIVGDNWGLFSVGLLVVFILITYLAWRYVRTLANEVPKKEKTDPISKA
jgi:membrane protein DedA with SNARE-associated domain